MPAARADDRDDGGEAVGDQQPAEQIDFLFEGKAVNGHDNQEPGDDPCDAANETACGERAQAKGIGFFGAFFAEAAHVVGAVFLGRDHGPQDREEERDRAEPEAEADGVGNDAGGRLVGNAEIIEQVRDDRSDHRARADEGSLHRIARRMLVFAQHIADEGAERLHRDVERLASSSHSMSAATSKAGAIGIASSDSAARMAPARK